MQCTGIITDTDAPQQLLDELIKPLGVPILVLPAITIVTKDGVVAPHRILGKAVALDRGLKREASAIQSFLQASHAGLIVNCWQISLGRYFTKFEQLPPNVRLVHVAAQFAQLDVPLSQVNSTMGCVARGTIEVMAQVFSHSGGRCVAITATGASGSSIAIRGRARTSVGASATLPPILELPTAIGESPPASPLLLCYFLTQAPARRLDQLLHKHASTLAPGLEIHCFTPEPLKPPRGRSLAIHSHRKQRGLFQELFSRCTCVLTSTGNETIWEAVCRGVPVLTIPTAGHGEQLLNAGVHARSLPLHVRTRSSLKLKDVRWLVKYVPTDASRAESARLRERCTMLASPDGLDALLVQSAGATVGGGLVSEVGTV
jgi:hypothetical protein